MKAGDTVRVLWHDAPVYGTWLPRLRSTPMGLVRVLVSGIVMLAAINGADAPEGGEGDEREAEGEADDAQVHGASMGTELGAGESAT